MRLSLTILGLLVLGYDCTVAAQEHSSASEATKPKAFEVVSIKPNKEGTSGGVQELANGERYVNTTLNVLVEGAYGRFSENEVLGMPSWAKSERYDIDLRIDANTANEWKNLSDKERFEQEQAMLQSMLADRCQLKAHLETKELPVYELVVAKGGLRMKEAAAGEEFSGGFRTGEITGRAMRIQELTRGLPSDGRSILDKTGLGDKKFDFDLKWTPENRIESGESGESGPSLFTALEEQLGLKLISSKAPAKVCVIDHLERPTPN